MGYYGPAYVGYSQSGAFGSMEIEPYWHLTCLCYLPFVDYVRKVLFFFVKMLGSIGNLVPFFLLHLGLVMTLNLY